MLTLVLTVDTRTVDTRTHCQISPEGYAHMTQMLSSLAGGKVIVALEVRYTMLPQGTMPVCGQRPRPQYRFCLPQNRPAR